MTVERGIITSISQTRPKGDFDVFEMNKTQFILPGLIDTHIHAPQYAFAGCGLDLPLLEWLNKYTFPAESKFSNMPHAQAVYNSIIEKTIAYGTTTGCYFATIYKDSSLMLAKICRERGQRAFIGKVSMDRNSPDYYIETTEEAISSLKSFIMDPEFSNSDLVRPILTPRFVPSTTSDLMDAIGQIAAENPNLLIQSHVSENENEIKWVHSLHSESESYTATYQDHNLLLPRTILAHGVHLTDSELVLLYESGASISHCPASNFQLNSGHCDVRRLQSAGINVSLGTDVSGGPSPSLIETMRLALVCSSSVLFQKRAEKDPEPYEPLTVPDVLSMATECGAKALGLDDKIGNFIVGKEFDAIVVDMNQGMTNCFGEESKIDLLDKFVKLADDRNILRVYVRGRALKFLK